jgi:hypothetical protein
MYLPPRHSIHEVSSVTVERSDYVAAGAQAAFGAEAGELLSAKGKTVHFSCSAACEGTITFSGDSSAPIPHPGQGQVPGLDGGQSTNPDHRPGRMPKAPLLRTLRM